MPNLSLYEMGQVNNTCGKSVCLSDWVLYTAVAFVLINSCIIAIIISIWNTHFADSIIANAYRCPPSNWSTFLNYIYFRFKSSLKLHLDIKLSRLQ